MNTFGALDLGAIEYKFTRKNTSCDTNIIKKRLDQAIYNVGWMLKYHFAFVLNEPFSCPNYCLIIMCLIKKSNSLPKQFRFFDASLRDPTCRLVVEKPWTSHVVGMNTTKLCKN